MCSVVEYIDRMTTRVSGNDFEMRRVASIPSSSGMTMSVWSWRKSYRPG
jgi:hypothetical protein